MPADFSTLKVAVGDGNDHTKFNNFVQAAEDGLNAIGDVTKTGFAPGLIFDPAQIKQGGATSGQWLAWSGTAWAPATPPATSITVIADTTLTANAASFDFLSISGSYKHLMLICYLRSDRTGASDDILGVRFNNDSGANYDGYTVQAFTQGTPTFAVGEVLGGTSAQQKNSLPAALAPAGLFHACQFFIPHYANAANNKVFHSVYQRETTTAAGGPSVLLGMGAWRSSVAITQVTLISANGANFLSGSRATLYGLG